MENKDKTTGATKKTEVRDKAGNKWQITQLPLPLGHTRIIARKRPSSKK